MKEQITQTDSSSQMASQKDISISSNISILTVQKLYDAILLSIPAIFAFGIFMSYITPILNMQLSIIISSLIAICVIGCGLFHDKFKIK